MKQSDMVMGNHSNRRSFLQKGMVAGAAALGTGMLTGGLSAFGRERENDSHDLTKGDVAVLRLLAAAEIVETDLWLQYSELGGTQDNEVQGVKGGNPLYAAALQLLDGDMSQYVHDNTDDEISHETFLNAYLASKGVPPVNLDEFRKLPSSTAKGARQIGRLHKLDATQCGYEFLDPVSHRQQKP
jgi:hypothetical protein